MLQRFLFHQAARFPKFFNDRGIGFKYELSGKKVHLRRKTPVVVDRGIGLQPILHADFVVFTAVPGRRMHAPGAGLKGHMIAQNHQRIPLIEWVPAFQVFQFAGRHFGQNRVGCNAEFFHAGFHHVPSQNKHFLVRNLDGGINEIRMQGNGQICRKGPGRGGPDHDGNGFTGNTRHLAAQIRLKGELDKDGRRGFIMVFNFSLCQGRLALTAPVNGFFAAKQIVRQCEFQAFGGNDRLVGVVHGQIGIVPFPHDTQAFEFFSLNINEFFGINPALTADIGLRHVFFPVSELLVHIVFNGKSVAVPTRDIRCIKARHLAGSDDNIL